MWMMIEASCPNCLNEFSLGWEEPHLVHPARTGELLPPVQRQALEEPLLHQNNNGAGNNLNMNMVLP